MRLTDETRGMGYNELMQHILQKVNRSSKRVYFERCELSKKTFVTINRSTAGSGVTSVSGVTTTRSPMAFCADRHPSSSRV